MARHRTLARHRGRTQREKELRHQRRLPEEHLPVGSSTDATDRRLDEGERQPDRHHGGTGRHVRLLHAGINATTFQLTIEYVGPDDPTGRLYIP